MNRRRRSCKKKNALRPRSNASAQNSNDDRDSRKRSKKNTNRRYPVDDANKNISPTASCDEGRDTSLASSANKKSWEYCEKIAKQFQRAITKGPEGYNWNEVLRMVADSRIVHLIFTQFEDALQKACEEGRLDVVQHLMDDHNVGLTFQHPDKQTVTSLFPFALQHKGYEQQEDELSEDEQQEDDEHHETNPKMTREEFAYMTKCIKLGPNYLFAAIKGGHTHVVEYFLSSHGMSLPVNFRHAPGPPLHLAVYLGHTDIVELLLQHPDINVNLLRPDGMTPLHIAVIHDEHESASLLLQNPSLRVNKLSGRVNKSLYPGSQKQVASKETALSMACRYRNIKLVHQILRHPDTIPSQIDSLVQCSLHHDVKNKKLSDTHLSSTILLLLSKYKRKQEVKNLSIVLQEFPPDVDVCEKIANALALTTVHYATYRCIMIKTLKNPDQQDPQRVSALTIFNNVARTIHSAIQADQVKHLVGSVYNKAEYFELILTSLRQMTRKYQRQVQWGRQCHVKVTKAALQQVYQWLKKK